MSPVRRQVALALGVLLTTGLATGHVGAAASARQEPGTAYAHRTAAATVAVNPAKDESKDFRFPGADLMRIPGTSDYVAFGASTKGKRGKKLPWTKVAFRNGRFVRRGAVDGDAWRKVAFPRDYWAYRGSTLWTPAVVAHREGSARKPVYYLFYSAKVTKDADRRCIGYATATSWRGTWRPSRRPLFCPTRRWGIDADISTGPGGTVWMTLRNGAWTKNKYTALGAVRLRLGARRATMVGQPRKLIQNRPQMDWTRVASHDRPVYTIENPNAVFVRGNWYLFFSGNHWMNNHYSTGVAFCGKRLVDNACAPLSTKKAYFAYAPPKHARGAFKPGLKPSMRLRTLPGNKRGPGAFDAFRAPDGTWWASWNYISDHTTGHARRSRIAPLRVGGKGRTPGFRVVWNP